MVEEGDSGDTERGAVLAVVGDTMHCPVCPYFIEVRSAPNGRHLVLDGHDPNCPLTKLWKIQQGEVEPVQKPVARTLVCIEHLGAEVALILDDRMGDMDVKWEDQPVRISQDMSGYCAVCDPAQFSTSDYAIEAFRRESK